MTSSQPTYASAVIAGDFLWTAGQVGTSGAPVAKQCDEVLAALNRIVANHGRSLRSVLRVECHLAERANFAPWAAAFVRAFPHDPPARTTVISSLLDPGWALEIQAVIWLGEAPPNFHGSDGSGQCASRSSK